MLLLWLCLCEKVYVQMLLAYLICPPFLAISLSFSMKKKQHIIGLYLPNDCSFVAKIDLK